MSASWATSTVCSPAVSSRASVSVERRRSRSAGSAAADRSSASGTRRRVSSVPSPSSVSRTNTDPGEPLLVGIEVHVHRLRRPGDRPADAAALLVAGDGQPAVGPSLPGLEEGMRQQRQRPGLTGHVAEHQVDEARLEGQARDPGGLLDRLPRSPSSSIGVSSAVDVSSAAANAGTEPLKPKKSARMTSTTRADPDGRRGGGEQRGAERRPLVRVVAQREALLELVDDEDQPLDRRGGDEAGEGCGVGLEPRQEGSGRRPERPGARRRELGERMRPGGQDDRRPPLAVQEGAGVEGGQDARSYERRLAAPGGAHHREEALGGRAGRAGRRRRRPVRSRARRPPPGTRAGPCTDTSGSPRSGPAPLGGRARPRDPRRRRTGPARRGRGGGCRRSRPPRPRPRRCPPAAAPTRADASSATSSAVSPTRARRSAPERSASSSARWDVTTSMRPSMGGVTSAATRDRVAARRVVQTVDHEQQRLGGGGPPEDAPHRVGDAPTPAVRGRGDEVGDPRRQGRHQLHEGAAVVADPLPQHGGRARRGVPAQRLGHGLVGQVGVGLAAPVEHDATVDMGGRGQLGHEPGRAHAGLAGDDDGGRPPVPHGGPAGQELRHLVVPSDHRRRRLAASPEGSGISGCPGSGSHAISQQASGSLNPLSS